MKATLLLLATLPIACSRPALPPAESPPAASSATPSASVNDPLTREVWLRSDPPAAPGELLAFLPGGSLLMTSCGEPYRLARWQREGDTLRWDEDGEPVRARLVAVDGEALRLELQLRGGPEPRRYRAGREARTCPDLPR